MGKTWTEVQKQRLIELNAAPEDINKTFPTTIARNTYFHELVNNLVGTSKNLLEKFRTTDRRPSLIRLENTLAGALTEHGFVQVTTPVILSRGLLEKMSIDQNHTLSSQVFWIDRNKCLRPMLAPNLYFILRDLLRLWPHPVRIFEIGICFRKDTEGAHHLNEFTMLNLVEMGLPLEECQNRQRELADLVMKIAGISKYCLEETTSEVYGKTMDITSGFELGSGAVGPHPLDQHWGITVPWVGIGFGLERLLMTKHNSTNIKREGKSLTYLDGVRLNI